MTDALPDEFEQSVKNIAENHEGVKVHYVSSAPNVGTGPKTYAEISVPGDTIPAQVLIDLGDADVSVLNTIEYEGDTGLTVAPNIRDDE